MLFRSVRVPLHHPVQFRSGGAPALARLVAPHALGGRVVEEHLFAPLGVAPGAASIRLHRRSLDLVAPVVASHGEHRSRRVLLVEIICADGTVGWGECGAPDDPSYTGETADGAAAFLERVIGPAFVASNIVSASQVAPLIAAVDTDARARHPMAVAAVEMAVLDAQLRAADLAFESTFPVAARRVAVAGATLRSGPIDVVVADAVDAVADGYSRLKVKIGPGLNGTDTIRAIREIGRAHV